MAGFQIDTFFRQSEDTPVHAYSKIAVSSLVLKAEISSG